MKNQTKPNHFVFKAMGSQCELKLYPTKNNSVEDIAQSAISEIERVEQKYSRYKMDSMLSAINEVANLAQSINVDDETLALLNYADVCYKQSEGLFDVTSGVLREAWDFKSGVIPTQEKIDEVVGRIGWNKVTIKSNTISFYETGMQLDFGGIGKEYAADRAATICMQHGIHHGLVNLGGDIKIIGPHLDGSPWDIGIRHPRKENQTLASIKVSSGGVSSSGDYERCITIDGTRYSHILNPKTGWPVHGIASITVVADQSVLAGSAATITMLNGIKGKHWVKKLGLPYLLMDDQGLIAGTIAA